MCRAMPPTTWPGSTSRSSPRRELAAWEVDQRFYEIGSFEGLEETRRYLAAGTGSLTGSAT